MGLRAGEAPFRAAMLRCRTMHGGSFDEGDMLRIIRLAILESYGVEWSLTTFARDVLQNFFDATPDFREVTIERDEAARTLVVRGPAEFDLDLLAYLGATTKNDGASAGGFGEGFKICALVGVRDFGLAVRAGSGDTEIEVFFDPVPLGRELCYRMTRREAGARGSFVRLEGCSDACFEAFAEARDLFLHPDNPKLGALIGEDEERTVAVYASTLGPRGELYYRRQQRGEVRYWGHGALVVPLTLACHAPVAELEGDRDRREIAAHKLARVVAARLPPERLHAATLALMAQWRHGHEILNAFLEVAAERKLRFDWPRGWLARMGGRNDGLTAMAERQGHRIAVTGFAALGMPTARDRYSFGLETRVPTPPERARIDAGVELYAALLGVERIDKPFEVFDSERAAVQGQHLGDRVIVDAKLLRPGRFAEATGTVLHELAHEVGGEDSPAFQNRLGRLLGASIRGRDLVERARDAFARARPSPAPPPSARITPYAPEEDLQGVTYAPAVRCVLYVPPAFPPTETIAERIQSVRDGEDDKLPSVRVVLVTSQRQAERLAVPGLPTLIVDGRDVDPEGAGEPGYRLRTYGPGRELAPSEEAIRAAINAGRARKPRHPVAYDAAASERRSRNTWTGFRCLEWAGFGDRRGLSRAWSAGLLAACNERIAAHANDAEPDHDELYEIVVAEAREGLPPSREARAADATFEPGDELEEHAMGAAQGAFVAAHAREGRAGAERAFGLVRALWAKLDEADLSAGVREAVMIWCLGHGGLGVADDDARALDEDRFQAGAAAALGEAARYQRVLDAEERWPDSHQLYRLLDRAVDPDAAAQCDEDAREERRKKQRERARAERTLAVKAAWDEALAATSSELAAAEACLAAAARLFGSGAGGR